MLVFSVNHEDTPTLMLPLCRTEALNYFTAIFLGIFYIKHYPPPTPQY